MEELLNQELLNNEKIINRLIKKSDAQIELINAFTQWFLYHHMDFDINIKNKIDKLQECEG